MCQSAPTQDLSVVRVRPGGRFQTGVLSLSSTHLVFEPGDRLRADAWLVPAPLEAHIHVQELPGTVAAELVRSGITRIRDVGGDPAVVDAWASLSNLVVAKFGGPADQDPLPPHLAGRFGSVPIRHFGQVRDHLRGLVASDCQGVKLYYGFPPELVYPTVKLAHDMGLRVAFHCATGSLPAFGRTRATDALAAGVDSIEHVHSLTADLLAPTILSQFSKDRIHTVGDAFDRIFRAWAQIDPHAVEARRLADRFADSGAVFVPTLLPFRDMSRAGAAHGGSGASGTVAAYTTQATVSPEERLRAFRNMSEIVAYFSSEGVRVACGTDAAGGVGMAATRTHEEMGLLRRAGLSAEEVLRCGSPPADVLDRLGYADLPDKRDDVLLAGETLDVALADWNVLLVSRDTRVLFADPDRFRVEPKAY